MPCRGLPLSTKPSAAARRHIQFRMLRRLHESGLDREKIILFFRLVDRVLTLSSANHRLFWEELKAYEVEKHMPYITSVERSGIEQGRKLGGAEELRNALHTLLSTRLGPVPDRLKADLESLEEPEQLQSLVAVAALCQSIEEFEKAMG